MNHLLQQLILAAKNDRGEDGGWQQILVFLIVATFWIVGGIAKAKSRKQEKQGLQQPPRRPGLTPQRPQYTPQPQQRRPQQTEPAPQRKITRIKPTVAEPLPATAKLSPFALPELDVKIPSKIPAMQSSITLPTALTSHKKPVSAVVTVADELFADYSDPASLKRAILHYEILGKPLSLRDPTA